MHRGSSSAEISLVQSVLGPKCPYTRQTHSKPIHTAIRVYRHFDFVIMDWLGVMA